MAQNTVDFVVVQVGAHFNSLWNFRLLKKGTESIFLFSLTHMMSVMSVLGQLATGVVKFLLFSDWALASSAVA